MTDTPPAIIIEGLTGKKFLLFAQIEALYRIVLDDCCRAAENTIMAEIDTVTIYIYLLNEGVDVWRPVEAVQIEESIYRIISENQNPDDENWEFSEDDIVFCKEKQLSNGLHFVAVEKA